MIADYRRALDEGGAVALNVISGLEPSAARDWAGLQDGDVNITAGTGVGADRIQQLGQRILTLPEDFKLHPRVAKIMENRQKMLDGEVQGDWGFAENLAYATILDDGYSIRLSANNRRQAYSPRGATVLPNPHGTAPGFSLRENGVYFAAMPRS